MEEADCCGCAIRDERCRLRRARGDERQHGVEGLADGVLAAPARELGRPFVQVADPTPIVHGDHTLRERLQHDTVELLGGVRAPRGAAQQIGEDAREDTCADQRREPDVIQGITAAERTARRDEEQGRAKPRDGGGDEPGADSPQRRARHHWHDEQHQARRVAVRAPQHHEGEHAQQRERDCEDVVTLGGAGTERLERECFAPAVVPSRHRGSLRRMVALVRQYAPDDGKA